MVANVGMLGKDDVISYVSANAYKYGLDAAAVLAVADHEGLNHGPDSGKGLTWVVPGEPTFSFGPPSWYAGGAGANIVKMQGNDAAYWSWTPAGIDYWLEQVAASGASGLTGDAAIRQIVGGYGWGFERPADPSLGNRLAHDAYNKFLVLVNQSNPGNPIVPVPSQPGTITIPGQTGPGQLPIPSNPQKPAPAPAQTTAKFSLHLFDLPTGPVNLTLPWDFSGILMFLAALFAIIIGALLWKPSRGAITTTAAMAA